MEEFLNSLTAWNWLVYLVVFLSVLIESIGLPIPGLTAAMVGAALAGQNRLDFWLVFFLTLLAGTVGGMLGYGVGKIGGDRIMRHYSNRFWLTPDRLASGEKLFVRHGGKAILFSRFLPVLCFASGLMSGVARLDFRRFSLYNFLGMAFWAISQLTLAYAFGRSLDVLLSFMNWFGLACIALLIIIGGLYYFVRVRKRKPKPLTLLTQPPGVISPNSDKTPPAK